MSARGDTPQQHGQEERTLDADPVNEAALQHKADGITDLEPEVDVGVIHRRPAHLLGEERLHDAKGGTVDVVQCGGKKYQGEHAPAGFTDGHGIADFSADTRVRRSRAGSYFGMKHGVRPYS